MPVKDADNRTYSGQGFIVLDRALRTHWVSETHCRQYAWIDILYEASYDTHDVSSDYGLKECKRGQIITSLAILAGRWKVTVSQARTILTGMKKNKLISERSSNQNRVITICNYDKYQLKLNKDSKQTDKQIDKQTDKQTASNLTPSKEIIKEKIKNLLITTTQELQYYINVAGKSKKTLPEGGGELVAKATALHDILPDHNTDEYYQLNALIMQVRNILSPPVDKQSYTKAELPDLQKELIQSDKWHQGTCMKMKNEYNLTINAEALKLKIPVFIEVVANQYLIPVKLRDEKIHFERWLKINLNIELRNQDKKLKQQDKTHATNSVSKTENTFRTVMGSSAAIIRQMQEQEGNY